MIHLFTFHYYCPRCKNEWAEDGNHRALKQCPKCPNVYCMPFDTELLHTEEDYDHLRTDAAPE